jgi:hypothetical protein
MKNKKFSLLVAFCLLVVIVMMGCKSGNEPKEENLPKIIDALQEVDILHSNYLDTIFSGRNQLIPTDYNTEKNIYIINSKEELNAINFFGFDVDIDFSKYTLVGGRVATSSISNWIHEILLEERDKDYLFSISMKVPYSAWHVLDNKYFWRLYPKLKKEKLIITELIIIKE